MRISSGCAVLWLAVASALLAAPRLPRAPRGARPARAAVARDRGSMSAVIAREAEKRRAPIVVRLAGDREAFAVPTQQWFGGSNLTSVSFGGARADRAVRTSP